MRSRVQPATALLAAVLALGLAGCSRKGPPSPAPSTAKVAPAAPTPESEAAPEQAPAPGEPSFLKASPQAAPSVGDAGSAGEMSEDIELGLSREAFLARLGPCAHRVLLMTAGSQPSEVFQPKAGECVKRFGERQFYLLGGHVARIQAGLSHYVPPKHPKETAAY